MLKRIFALMFCGVLFLSFVACADSAGNTDSGSQQNSAETSTDSQSVGSGTDIVTDSSVSTSVEDTVDLWVYDDDIDHKFLACDTYNESIAVYDIARCNEVFDNLSKEFTVVWEWVAGEDTTCKGNPGSGLDAAKFRYSEHYKKDVVIACSSEGWAGIIDYETKTTLWETQIEGSNLHSVEMMPNGDMILVGSGDEGKLYYVPLSTGATEYTRTLFSPHGHGACYDPSTQWVWVLDYDEIYACQIADYGTKDANFVRVEGQSYNFLKTEQDKGGHVLAPVYGQPGKYWVTGKKMWIFDSKTLTLDQSYEDADVYADSEEVVNLKGIASFEDGTMVQTIAQWGGQTLTSVTCGGFRVLVREESDNAQAPVDVNVYRIYYRPNQREFYKVTTFTKNYQ